MVGMCTGKHMRGKCPDLNGCDNNAAPEVANGAKASVLASAHGALLMGPEWSRKILFSTLPEPFLARSASENSTRRGTL